MTPKELHRRGFIHNARKSWMQLLKNHDVTSTGEAMNVLHEMYWRAMIKYVKSDLQEPYYFIVRGYEDLIHIEETMRELKSPLEIV